MLHAPQDEERGLELAERRNRTRLDVPFAMFVRLDDRNGGVVLNLSEDGLAVRTARSVQEVALPFLRIQFPESPEWIPVGAEVVWRSESTKEAGVRFVGLHEDARQKIIAWISTQAALDEFSWESKVRSTFEARIPDEVAETISSDLQAPLDESASAPAEQPEQEREDPVAYVSQSGSSPSGRERRTQPRTRIVPLGCLELGEENGGIALNVSEDGLAVTAGVVLVDDHLPSIRLLFPDADDWIEASGEIAWRSESKKEAGVRFVNLTEEARRQIRNWISSQTPPYEVPGEVGESIGREEKPSETSESSVVVDAIPVTAVPDGTNRNGEPFLSGPSFPDLPDVGLSVPVAENYFPTQEQASHWVSRFLEKLVDDPRKPVAIAALVAGVSLFVVWLVLHRDVQNPTTVSAVRALRTDVSPRIDNGVPPPLPNASRPDQATVPGEQSPEDRSDGEEERSHQLSEGNPQAALAAKTPPSASTVSEVRRPAKRDAVAPGAVVEKPARVSHWTISRPVTRAPLKSDSGAPSGPPQLEKGVGALASGPANSPNDSLDAGLAKEENPVPARKQPEVPASRSAMVEILADPYPSIRIPPEQKTRKPAKANSFELGRLISRLEPVYPEDAKQRGIQGVVKVRAIVGRDGTITQVQADGPAELVQVAKNAVRQWRYTQTLVAGQPVETEENIDITFRLSSQ